MKAVVAVLLSVIGPTKYDVSGKVKCSAGQSSVDQ